jgi:hypothetical protein
VTAARGQTETWGNNSLLSFKVSANGFGSFFGEGGATVSGRGFRDDAADEKENGALALRELGAQTAKGRLQ